MVLIPKPNNSFAISLSESLSLDSTGDLSFEIKSIYLSFALLVIWIIQLTIWKIFHDLYYEI